MLPKRYKSLIKTSIRLQNITNVISLYWLQICRNKKFFSNLSVGQILPIKSDLYILPPCHHISIWSLIYFVLQLFFIRRVIDFSHFSSIMVVDINYYNLTIKWAFGESWKLHFTPAFSCLFFFFFSSAHEQ